MNEFAYFFHEHWLHAVLVIGALIAIYFVYKDRQKLR